MEVITIALFGEAEKGDFKTPYFCQTMPQLIDCFGNPPPQSLGLYFATQTLLYHRNLIFFRVKEEGYSAQDYYIGLQILEMQATNPQITAICLPGVGSNEILQVMTPFCKTHHSILITTGADLYDYLTSVIGF
jgi:hypothetical protein